MKKKLVITTAVLAIITVIVVAVYFIFKEKIERKRKDGSPKPINPSIKDKLIEIIYPREKESENAVIQNNQVQQEFNVDKISSVKNVSIGTPFPQFKDWREKYNSATEFTHDNHKWRVEKSSIQTQCIKAPCNSIDTYYLIYLGEDILF